MHQRNFVSFYLAVSSLLIAIAFFLIPSVFIEAQTTSRILVGLVTSTTCTNGTPSVQLTWTNPNGAKDFTVFRNPNAAGTKSWRQIAKVVPTAYTDTTAQPGISYQYQVRAVSPTGSERHSDMMTVSPQPCATKLTFNPTIATQCTNGTPIASLSWSNPNNATSYTVFRNPSLDGTKSWGIIASPASQTLANIKLKNGSSYQYQIRAVSPEGSVRYSDILNTQNLSCATASIAPTTPATTATLVSAPAHTTTPTAPVASNLKWGAYSGWQESDMAQFETTVGGSPDHMAAFTHWGNSNVFPTYMSKFTKDKGRTLIIFWEPSNHNIASTDQPAFSYDAILRGDWDDYIKSFAVQAKVYGGPVILIPFSEMNGNWNSWSGVTNGNTPAKAVEGYRHVRRVFGDVPNVKFGWAPNQVSVPNTPENQFEKYYPGNEYVDIVGLDGFNFGDPWLTFDELFGKPLARISVYNKPIYIFSFASAAGPAKAAWITDAITKQMPKYPLIQGYTLFNQNKEQNWLIWSDAASLAAFKAVAK